DIDSRQGRHRKPALTLIAQRVVKSGPNLLCLHRILPDEPVGICLDDSRIGSSRAEAFTPSNRAIIANHLDQNVGPTIKAHGGAFKRHIQPDIKKMSIYSNDLH